MPDSTEAQPLTVRTVRGMGRGVFAGRPFRKGDVIEVCPVVLIPEETERQCRGGIIERYIFAWNKTGDVAAIALGYGSLYNHSPHANATFTTRKRDKVIVFRARRDIQPGEQILIDYAWKEEDYHFPTPARTIAAKK